MRLDWLGIGRGTNVNELLAKKRYRQAIDVLKEEIKERPTESRYILLADIYVDTGNKEQAIKVLMGLADQLAGGGQPGKAIAVLKRMQRIDPEQSGVYDSLAALIQGDRPAEPTMPIDLEALDLGIEFEPIPETPPVREAESIPPPPATDAGTAPPPSEEELRFLENAVPSPLFDSFSRDELLAVMRGLRLITVDPGDVIVAQGDPGDSLFLVATGIVKAFVKEGDRNHRQVRMLNDGDFFGEISILSGAPRTATITAATTCDLLELDRTTLDAIASSHPRVTEVLREFYEQRVGNARTL